MGKGEDFTKKLLAIFMTLLMSMSLLAGCGGSEPAV